MSRYTFSVTRQPTFFLWLAFLLTALVGTAPALPAVGVWQCRYDSRVVSATAAVPGAMPCRSMPMSGMGHMACCAARHSISAHGPHLAAPFCHPTFTPLAAVSLAVTEQGRVALPLPVAVPGAPPRGPASLAPALLSLPLRQRPPPGPDLLRACFASAYCLRGPPSA